MKIFGLCATLLLLARSATGQEDGASLTIAADGPFRRWHCFLRPATGLCKAAITKWYYDPKTKQCEEFTYGGCGGNKNRFGSKDECEARCAPRGPVCRLKPDGGPCDAAIHRWFFNSASGQCEQFVYGGCRGNKNNFQTRQECQKACRTDCAFVNCLVDPCEVTKCPAFREAKCIPNFCTGCDADFFVNGKLVDCGKKPIDRCTLEGEPCRILATTHAAASVGAAFLPRCCKGTECCACGPPVATQKDKPPRTGTCQKHCICPVG